MKRNYAKSLLLGLLALTPTAAFAAETAADAVPLSLPVTIEPTREQVDNSIVIVNANGDTKTWRFDGTAMEYQYDSYNKADDWFFIPVVATAADGPVKIDFDTRCSSTTYPEHLQVAYGNAATPAAMTVVYDQEIKFSNYTGQTAVAANEANGVLWIGFHATSEKDMNRLCVQNIRLSKANSPIPPEPEIVDSSIEYQEYTAKVAIPQKTLLDTDFAGTLTLVVTVGDTPHNYPVEPASVVDINLTLPVGENVIVFKLIHTFNGEDIPSDPVTRTVQATKVPEPLTLPVDFEATADNFKECTVINANNDDVTWKFDSSSKGASFKYSYSGSNAADDWLFLPVILTGDTERVRIDFNTWVMGPSYPENLDVYIGKALDPATMTPVLECHGMTNMDPEPKSVEKNLEGYEGRLYVAFRCTSPANYYGVMVNGIKVTAVEKVDPADEVPAPSIIESNIEFQEYTAKVAIPAKSVAGTDFAGTLKLVAVIDGETESHEYATTPGATVDVALTVPSGRQTIIYTVVHSVGGKEISSEPVKDEVTSKRVPIVLSIPFVFTATPENFEDCTVVDNNTDNNTWTLLNDYSKPAFRYSYSPTNKADDWLILPVIRTNSVEYIKIEFNAWVQSYVNVESLEVYVGKSADITAMELVGSFPELTNMDAMKLEAEASIAGFGSEMYLAFRCVSEADKYALMINDISVTETTPADQSNLVPAPEVVESTIEYQEYTAKIVIPAKSVAGTDFAGTLKLIAKVSGDTETHTYATEAGATVDVALTLSVGTHTITYTVVHTTGENEYVSPAVETEVTATKAPRVLDLPVNFAATSYNFEDCRIIDGNGDEKTWKFDSNVLHGPAFAYTYSSTNAANDWLFIPGINAGEVKKVKIEFDVWVMNAIYSESVDLCFGRAIDTNAMEVLVECHDLTNTTPTTITVEKELTAEDALFYLAFHCVSPADRHTLLVSNIKVSEVEKIEGSDTAPAPELVESSIEFQEYTAKVAIPAKSIAGTDFEGTLKLVVNVSGQTEATEYAAEPGATVDVALTLPAGEQTITYTVVHTVGEEEIVSESIQDVVTATIEGADTAPAPEIVESSIEFQEYTAKVAIPAKSMGGTDFEGTLKLVVTVSGDSETREYAVEPGATVDVALTLPVGEQTVTYTIEHTVGEKTTTSEATEDTVTSTKLPVELELPVDFTASAENLSDCFVINANNDADTWKFEAETAGGTAFVCAGDNAADDWLFLPVINPGEAKSIKVEVCAWAEDSAHPASLDICFGKSVGTEAMETILKCGISNATPETYKGVKELAEGEGQFYIALHCVSDAGSKAVFVNSIRVSEGENSGIGGIAFGEGISVDGGTIVVSGHAGSIVAVYTLDGRMAASATAAEVSAIPVGAGIYVVCVDGTASKVIVR